ncbi:unnamed protein product [Malus baccata var. baccata]
MKGNPLFVIDNWGALHKDKNGQWINDVAQEKYDNMKKKKDEVREKLIEEAPEGTIFVSIQVPLEDEFGIKAENLGRKGQSVNGVDGFPKLQQENEQLRAQLDLQNDDETLTLKIKAFLAASQGQTSSNSKESDGNNSSSENVYLELEEHDSEEE